MIKSGDEVYNIGEIEEYASNNDGECIVAIAMTFDPFDDEMYSDSPVEYTTCVFESPEDARDRHAKKWDYFFSDEPENFPLNEYLAQ